MVIGAFRTWNRTLTWRNWSLIEVMPRLYGIYFVGMRDGTAHGSVFVYVVDYHVLIGLWGPVVGLLQVAWVVLSRCTTG